jgi:arsenite/tail-anchored protein-transporting ATPase
VPAVLTRLHACQFPARLALVTSPCVLTGPFVPALRAGAPPQYLFFGGKGGTGKTTCAAAAAIALAERGRHLLVVSTDPAHSLGDVFGRKLTPRPSKVPVRRGSLNACELDADRALGRWLADRRLALATIFQRGTMLDRGDVDPFLNLSLPGVDELLGLLEIERLGAEAAYDHIVIDTAPTGHTLRLLATPAFFTTFAHVLDLMQEKHRVLAATFGPGARGDGSEALIEELHRDGERLGALLRDRSRMRLCWVMLPEEMSVAESSRAVAGLQADGIRVSDMIVNRLTPPPPSTCALCDGRRHSEAKWVNAISTRWGGKDTRLWRLAAREEPPQGIAALRAMARSVSRLGSPATRRSAGRDDPRPDTAAPPHQALPAPVRPSRSTRMLIVGGKGGVGKTTCAATLALAIAREAPDRQVLLVSTDPAHSIGDVLGQPVGEAGRRIRGGTGNLVAREIDAARSWRERRERYRESIAHLFEMLSAGSNVDLTIDRAVIEELFELAPPGMDEVVGILAIIEALLPGLKATPPSGATRDEARFDLVLVDSAPTGHTLRLLALPVQAQAWVRQLMAVVLKYKVIGGFEHLASELMWLSRGLKRLQELLTNPRACGFLVVTRPEQLAALETIRLIEWLQRHRIPRRALIVNGVTPPGCARCRRTAARERRQIATFTRRPAWKRGGGAIILTDAITPPPRGRAALSGWEHTWRATPEGRTNVRGQR